MSIVEIVGIVMLTGIAIFCAGVIAHWYWFDRKWGDNEQWRENEDK